MTQTEVHIPYLNMSNSRGEFLLLFTALTGVPTEECAELQRKLGAGENIYAFYRRWMDKPCRRLREGNIARARIVRAKTEEEIIEALDRFRSRYQQLGGESHCTLKYHGDTLDDKRLSAIIGVSRILLDENWWSTDYFPGNICDVVWRMLVGKYEDYSTLPKNKNIRRMDDFGTRSYVACNHNLLKSLQSDESLFETLKPDGKELYRSQPLRITEKTTFVVDGENMQAQVVFAFLNAQLVCEDDSLLELLVFADRDNQGAWPLANKLSRYKCNITFMPRVLAGKSIVDLSIAMSAQKVLSEGTSKLYILSSDSDMSAIHYVLRNERIGYIVRQANTANDWFRIIKSTPNISVCVLAESYIKFNVYLYSVAFWVEYFKTLSEETLHSDFLDCDNEDAWHTLGAKKIGRWVLSLYLNGIDPIEYVYNYK